MFPHGLTNLPTQSYQRGVGLEPTAYGKGKSFVCSSTKEGSQTPRPTSLGSGYLGHIVSVEGRSASLWLRPCTLGLSPCCDYSIAYLCHVVNTFLKEK